MNETLILEIIFWSALFMVFYTYLGYGIVLYALVKLKELFVKPVKRVLPPDSDLPEVTPSSPPSTKKTWWTKRWRTASPWTTLRTNSASSG